MGLDRSRKVLTDDFISKLELWTGPQAVTGSTRMQATTIETFVIGIVLEEAILQFCQKIMPTEESLFDLSKSGACLADKLTTFSELHKAVLAQVDSLSKMTKLETDCYASKKTAVYFADEALLSVFTDCTERAPTFSLNPLDTIGKQTYSI